MKSSNLDRGRHQAGSAPIWQPGNLFEGTATAMYVLNVNTVVIRREDDESHKVSISAAIVGATVIVSNENA